MTYSRKDPIYQKVYTAMDPIREYLWNDGGDMVINEITDDFTVRVSLTGKCKECDVNKEIMMDGVLHVVRKSAPEIRQIELIH
ncbi:MAG: NifU family protein [Bacteroidales bacterium]|nr:NifU family protein [Bacteroidales bacterium]